jgi:diacylglycerol kinase family enzyme
LSASLAVLRRHPFLAVRIKAGGIEAVLRTPQVFIGNNRYATDGWDVGERPRMDQGVLSVYVVRCGSRVGLWMVALRALLVRLRQARDFDMREAPELVIESRRVRLQVALDGELATLATPLRYRIRPRALRLMAPAPA